MTVNSRAKGNAAEVLVARWLREHGYPDARTTRSLLGHGGTRQPGDIAGVPNASIEVKNRRQLDIGVALDQAKRQAAPGELPLLIVKPYRIVDVGEWFAMTTVRELLICHNSAFLTR